MSASRARDALVEMRRCVGLAMGKAITENDARMHLRDASRWAQVYLAESKATEYALAMKERSENNSSGQWTTQ